MKYVKKLAKAKRREQRRYIREYVRYHLRTQDIKGIDGKILKNCSDELICDKFREIFNCDPARRYMEQKHNLKIELKKNKNNFIDGDYVYFFMTKNRQYVKIGYSKNPYGRIKEVQTGCPLELMLIGYVKGDLKEERRIHEMFNRYRKHGEWFAVTGDLLYYMINRFYI